MADEIQELEEISLFMGVLNVANEYLNEFNISEDPAELNNEAVREIDGDDCDEEMETFDNNFPELDEYDYADDFKNIDADILQCIINMIELEYILNNDAQLKRRRKRRWGVHPINQMRNEHGHFQNLFEEMLSHDHEKFFNFTRMTPERFYHLLELVEPKITKYAPNAIPAKCRLLITLRYFN